MPRRLIVMLAACLAAPAFAAAPAEDAKLAATAARGQLIYEIDRAAWVTTDEVMARVPAARQWPIAGWIVEHEDAGAYKVTYYGGPAKAPVAFYVGRAKDGRALAGNLIDPAARPPLSPAQVDLVRARNAVAKLDYKPCTAARFNIAVIPPDAAGGPIDVYLLTAQTDASVMPFGGHYLARVAANGRLVSHRRFTNSCLNMPAAGAGLPKDATPVAAVISHLLDPVPTEIHVFLSLWTKKPVYVSTGAKRLWIVDGTRIRPVRR